MRPLYSLFLLCLAMMAGPVTAQITVANSGGFWGDATTWSTGAVPTAADDVVIEDSTVTIDIADAVANNVTVSGEGTLRTNRGFATNTPVGLTVFGNLTISGSDAEFLPLSNQDENGVGFGEIYHRLTVHGDIDNSTGGTFDMRRGATSSTPATASFIDLVFAGSEDATMTLGDYDSNDNQLFRVEVAKTDGATISLGNDATVDNNSRAVFTLTSGYMDTGDFRFTLISNNSQVVQGGSPASYVLGEFARGLPKGTVSSQNKRTYPVGDADAYTPATVYVTERSSDDQFMGVRVIPGDADNGSSVLEGGLTDVSAVRYFAFEWYFFDSSDAINIDRVEISYGATDKVPEGSTDFVVASSVDGRATWTNAGGVNPDGSAHTTSLATPPTPLKTDSLTTWAFDFELVGTDILNDVYYAAIGTSSAFVALEDDVFAEETGLTTAPNPSTGRTTVSFALAEATDVTVEVFDVLGRRVATLADGPLPVGTHDLRWEADGQASGLYLVRLQSGSKVTSRTLTLTR